MKVELNRKEIALIIGNLSFTLSTLTDKKQRKSIESVMDKLFALHAVRETGGKK